MQAQQLQQQLQQQPPAVSYKLAVQLGEVLTQKLIQLDNVNVSGMMCGMCYVVNVCWLLALAAALKGPSVCCTGLITPWAPYLCGTSGKKWACRI